MNKKEIMGLCEFLKLHGYENADNISKFIFELQQENKLLNKKYLDAVTDYEQTMSENKQLESIIYEIREYMLDIDYKMGWQYVEYLDRLLPEELLKKEIKMRYFYEYKYKDGGIVGGHNLEKIEFYDNYIKLSGVDIITTMYEESHWGTLLDMNEIEYLKIEPMQELEGSDSNVKD